MATLPSHVQAEADAIDLELVDDGDRPALPLQATDTSLGLLSDDLRKLFVLQKRWRMQFEADQLLMPSAERAAREQQINELVTYFWSQVVVTFGLRDLGAVFVRQGWHVVVTQPACPCQLQHIAHLVQQHLGTPAGGVILVVS